MQKAFKPIDVTPEEKKLQNRIYKIFRINTNIPRYDYETGDPDGTMTYFVELYQHIYFDGRTKNRMNVYEENGRSQQPTHYGNGELGYDFEIPEVVRMQLSEIAKAELS